MKFRKLLVFSTIILALLLSYSLRDSNEEGTGTITGFSVKDNNLADYECPDCNVILILIDTLRADHVGAYGYDRDITPNIDKLAEEGILFKNMLAQSSWTKPGVASILTGLYPKNHGALNDDDALAEEIILLPEILAGYGYKSYSFITNPTVTTETGFNQGYESFEYFPPFEEERNYVNSNEMNNAIIPFLKNLENKEKNFIYLHYMDPHEPYDPPQQFYSLNNKVDPSIFKRSFEGDKILSGEITGSWVQQMINLYDDEIKFVDKDIGKIIFILKEQGMYDNSIIVVVSDHGEEFFEHGGFGHGKSLFQEQLKVPFILRIPKKQGFVFDQMVRQIDVTPTLLSFLGISFDIVDGTDIFDTLDGADIFDTSFDAKWSFAQLDKFGQKLNSIQSLDEKLIEGVRKVNVKWFSDRVDVLFSGGELEMALYSYLEDRKVGIFLNGKRVSERKITKDKEIISFSRKKTPLDKIDLINNLTIINMGLPCFNLSRAFLDDSRCFGIGVSIQGFNYSDEVPFKAFFQLKEDPKENFNLFQVKQKELKPLREKLLQYLSGGKVKSEKATPSPEQIEQLKSLGYI